jgi:hypothetical protein
LGKGIKDCLVWEFQVLQDWVVHHVPSSLALLILIADYSLKQWNIRRKGKAGFLVRSYYHTQFSTRDRACIAVAGLATRR